MLLAATKPPHYHSNSISKGTYFMAIILCDVCWFCYAAINAWAFACKRNTVQVCQLWEVGDGGGNWCWNTELNKCKKGG